MTKQGQTMPNCQTMCSLSKQPKSKVQPTAKVWSVVLGKLAAPQQTKRRRAKIHLCYIFEQNLCAEVKPLPYFFNACIQAKAALLIVSTFLKILDANCFAHDDDDNAVKVSYADVPRVDIAYRLFWCRLTSAPTYLLLTTLSAEKYPKYKQMLQIHPDKYIWFT